MMRNMISPFSPLYILHAVIDYFHKSIAAPLSKAGFFMEEQKKNITGWKASRDKDIKEKLKKAAEKAAK